MLGSVHVWHSSDALWSPPRKVSSERQPLALLYQPGTLGVKFLVGVVAETGAHKALPGYGLLWPCTCWLLLLKGRKEGWFLVTKSDSEWTDRWRIARVYTASPSLGYWQTFLFWQRTVEFVFTWEVALKEMAPTKERLFLGFVLFCFWR